MLILVRHGRTAHNAGRRLLGRLDVALDPLGRRQAQALADAFEVVRGDGDPPARVVSSPLVRARATAEAFGRPVEVDERWIEIDYGVRDGQLLAEVPSSFWDSWQADLSWKPEGGESLADVGRRVRDACEDLWPEAAERDVIVVSHVSPIKAAVAWALGVDDAINWRMHLDVAAVSRIGPGRGGPGLWSFNEVHHRPWS